MPFDDKFGFRQVEYQAHYDQFAAPFLIEKNEENNRYFVNQAKENHVYGVNNALLDLISDALTMLEVVRFTKDADHFLRFRRHAPSAHADVIVSKLPGHHHAGSRGSTDAGAVG